MNSFCVTITSADIFWARENKYWDILDKLQQVLRYIEHVKLSDEISGWITIPEIFWLRENKYWAILTKKKYGLRYFEHFKINAEIFR